MITRTEALCKALGWQGGTIHQVSQEIGVDTQTILYGKPTLGEGLNTPYSHGWFAGRTCSVEHNKANIFPLRKGDADFWLGVADGLRII